MSREHNPYTRRRYATRTQRSNAEAQRSGANAEHLVEQIATRYEATLRARVRKRHEPYKRVGGVGKNGLFKAVNTGASGVDFEVWLDDGRAGLMEVKSRKGARIQLGAIGATQACELSRMSHWGHLALVLVRLASQWYLLCFTAWTHESKRSLNATDLARQGVEVPVDRFGSPDFVSVIDDAQRRAAEYLAAIGSPTP